MFDVPELIGRYDRNQELQDSAVSMARPGDYLAFPEKNGGYRLVKIIDWDFEVGGNSKTLVLSETGPFRVKKRLHDSVDGAIYLPSRETLQRHPEISLT